MIVDNHTRECLALHVNQRIRSLDVVTALERITQAQVFAGRAQVDNGPEFVSKDFGRWAY